MEHKLKCVILETADKALFGRKKISTELIGNISQDILMRLKINFSTYYWVVSLCLFDVNQKFWVFEKGRIFQKYDIEYRVDYKNALVNGSIFIFGFFKELVEIEYNEKEVKLVQEICSKIYQSELKTLNLEVMKSNDPEKVRKYLEEFIENIYKHIQNEMQQYTFILNGAYCLESAFEYCTNQNEFNIPVLPLNMSQNEKAILLNLSFKKIKK